MIFICTILQIWSMLISQHMPENWRVVMLVTFAVKNYKGFKDRQELNLMATSGSDKTERLYVASENIRINRNACVVGPNGAGKSHLLEAIVQFAKAIRDNKDVLSAHQPYLLDKNSLDEPTEYEALLFDPEGERYVNYHFCVINGKVIKESVYFRENKKGAKKQLLFIREDGDLKYSSAFKSYGSLLSKTIGESGLALNYAPALNNDILLFVFNWAKEVLLFKPDFYNKGALKALEEIISNDNDGSNTGYNEYIDKRFERSAELLRSLSIPVERIYKTKDSDGKYNIFITHKGFDGKNIELSVEQASSFFSKGSLNAIIMVIYIVAADAVNSNITFLIDEYDGFLHHNLSTKIMSLLMSDKNEAKQIIIATHDLLLLDSGFRRDSIFFVEKDDSLISHITRLSDFAVRKDAKISQKYLSDEFGALPKIISNIGGQG